MVLCSRRFQPFVVLSLVSVILAARAPAANRPARPASAPASQAATEPYPSKALKEACTKTAGELRTKLDKSFAILVSPPFVIAGNLTAAELQGYASGSVVQPSKAMWKMYFRKKPQEPITVLLFADANSYAAWAKKLFKDTNLSPYGYYRREQRTMVMNIGTGPGTLIHELTHALIAPDFPDVPDWFNEGLASLHEGCRVGDDRIEGKVNWRLKGLHDAISAGKLRPLEELLTADDFYGDQRGVNYAQARYFIMYVQQNGLLEKFYKQYHDAHEGKRAAVDAVEAVFGKKIAQVEKEFLAWVKTLK